MRTAASLVLAFALSALALPIFLYQYLAYRKFGPYLEEIASYIQEAQEAERKLPDFTRDVVVKTIEPDFFERHASPEIKSLKAIVFADDYPPSNLPRITGQVSNYLFRTFSDDHGKGANHGLRGIWLFELQDHFSKEEILSAYYHSRTSGKGLSAGAGEWLQKRPAELTKQDLFYLMAVDQVGPPKSRDQAERVASVSEVLRKRYAAAL